MRRAALLALALAALGSAPAAAQATIESGMTPSQVRAAFGDPARVRETAGWTYYFYANGCPVRCGSDDVVFFQGDRVVAAVLRSRGRRFAGPGAARALNAIDPNPPAGAVVESAAAGEDGAPVTTIRIRGEGQPGQGVAGAQVEGVQVGGAAAGRPRPGVRMGTGGGSGSGGSVVVAPSPRDTAGLTRARAEDDGEPTRGLSPRGSRVVREGAAPMEPGNTEQSLDESRILRERQVQPRTIPAGQPGAARADTALDQERINRERRVEPRTIRAPQPGAPATPQRRAAPARPAAPADTARARGDTTGITPPRVPPS